LPGLNQQNDEVILLIQTGQPLQPLAPFGMTTMSPKATTLIRSNK